MSKRKKSGKGWSIVFGYIIRYKRDIVIYSILGVISAVTNGFIPLIFGAFFDAILGNEWFSYAGLRLPLWEALLIVGGVAQVIANVVEWSNDIRARRIGTYLASEYAAESIARLILMPLSLYKEQKIGSLWNKISRARNSLTQIVEQVVLNVTPQVLSVIVGFTVAFFINPILAGLILVGVILYVLALAKIVPPIVKLQRRGERAWSRAYGYAYDSLANIQPVKQAVAESYESERVWDQFINRVSKTWFNVEKIWGGISFYQSILITITRMGVFVLSAYFIQQGDLTIGGLMALNGYAAMVFGPFVRIGNYWQVIQGGIVAIENGEKLLSTRPEDYEPKNAVSFKKIQGEIEFQDVSFAYKHSKGKVLNGISFKIKPGEVVALMGESGVGKTTLIDLIPRYYSPNRGKILIDGHNIAEVRLKDLRGNIAVVPQEVVLFNDTIKNNIKYGNFSAKDAEIKKAAKEASADTFIEKFPKKYQQLVGERGVKLSVGQKQRVSIARAILRDPKILILDEPTSALDIQTEKQITESLEKLMKGRTTIIIAHRLSTVRKADKILVFDKGRLVEQGTHESLIKKRGGVYERLYKLHLGLK